MEATPLELPGLLLLTPNVFTDDRGHFFEWYNQDVLKHAGVDVRFVQANQSRSRRGVLRGLHFQRPPHAQDKLVRVTRGAVQDVVVDLRTGSPTYGRSLSVELSEENTHALFVPKGFAHGFLALSETVDFEYLVSDTWFPETEGGLTWNDPALKIDWRIADPILAPKDLTYPAFSALGEIFHYA